MNETGRPDPLDRVAQAVSDAQPVDWDRERAETPELAAELDSLRMLSRILDSNSDFLTVEHAEPAPGLPSVESPLFHWGSLAVLERLGGGSFGEVFRAYDPVLETQIALKLRRVIEGESDPAAIERFLREARRLARVRHSNVLTVYGADVRHGRVGIWTELVMGETLEQYLRAHGPLGPREVVGIGVDLCRALAAVHAAGLIHRDVKTLNVMREKGGRIVLMDFGSGVELPAPGAQAVSMGLHGTLLFMAPEQLSGGVAGPATDIYGLGVLLYRLLTGEFPVSGATMAELMEAHQRGPVPLRDRRPDLPLGLVRVIHKAIEPRPEDRYPTCGAMELALARCLDSDSGPDPSPGRRPRARWIMAGAAAVLAIVVYVALQIPTGPKPTPPLTASATLLRETAAGDEPLLPDTRIREGDRLALAIEGSAAMYVYVLDQDALGNVFVLYPLPGLQPQNPLSAGVRHRLPGATQDSTYTWAVTIEGQRDNVLVLASKQALTELERVIAALPKAQRGAPLHLDRRAILRLRGIGGVDSRPNPPASSVESGAAVGRGSRNIDLVSDLKRALAGSREVWLWEMTLENPQGSR